MPIVVQKFGGSSVADVGKIRQVARRVAQRRADGFQLVVVVSAMGDTTDELLGLAKQVSPNPPRRELDMLLTCGERISMALLSMALQEEGVPAISFTGSQSGIITDDNHAQARIIEVRPQRIHEALDQGRVVIVAGYQGVSLAREVTTLGRGGSDTTAVALAAALAAEACEIYSDVDGVFSADPRVVPDARRQETLSYDEMQALAHGGARVLNAQAVEFARAAGIVIHAKTAHGQGSGTRIQAERGKRAAGVTSDADVAVVRAQGEVGPRLLEVLRAERCPVRLWAGQGRGAASDVFAVLPLQDVHGKEALRRALEEQLPKEVQWREDLGTVTLVGQGVGTDPALLGRALALAAEQGAPAEALHATALEVALVVPRTALAELTRALHAAFIPGGDAAR